MFNGFKDWLHKRFDAPEPISFGTVEEQVTQNQVAFRQANAKDADAFEIIERQIYQASPWGRVGFLNELYHRERLYLAIMVNQQTVGYAGMSFNRRQLDAHITNLGIMPNFQGQGIGTKVIQHLLEVAQTQGMLTVSLEVKQHNPGAQRLYERLNFELLRVRHHYYRDDGDDALEMVISLPVKGEKGWQNKN